MKNKLSVWSNRLSILLIGAYLLAALVIFILAPIFAVRWFNTPFVGSFIEHTLALNSSGPSQGSEWDLQKLHLDFGHRITVLDGVKVTSVNQLNGLLSGHHAGDQVDVTITAPDGSTTPYSVTLVHFPFADLFTYFILPYCIALIYLGAGIWVFGFRRRDTSGLAFTIFTTSTAISLATLFDLMTTSHLTPLWTFALDFTGGGLIFLALTFPDEPKFINQRPLLRWVGLILALSLFLFSFPTLYSQDKPLVYAGWWRLGYIYTGLAIFVFLGFTLYRRIKSVSPVVREQSRLILIGSAFSFSPIGIWFLATAIWRSLAFSPFLILPVAIFPLIIAYTLARYRLLSVDMILRQVVIYSLIMLLAGAAFAFLVAGLTLIFGKSMHLDNPYTIAAILFLLAFLFNPLASRVQRLINAVFMRGQVFYRERAQAFSHDLTQIVSLKAICQILRRYIDETLAPYHLHIFMLNPISGQYEAVPDDTGKPTSDLRFSPSSPLPMMLASQRATLFIGGLSTLPAAIKQEKARINLLGSQLFVPLPGQRQLIGWLSLGSQRSGAPFKQQDLALLETLCDQAALAIERAQVVSDLERRVNDMNVLTQLSQGINVTLEFDDILELVYTRSIEVIPTKDYWITLYEPSSETINYRFVVQNDERIRENEEVPIPKGQGLERVVIYSQRPLNTDDYEHECRLKGLIPIIGGIFAWVGVPLNDGANTIGVISLGSRDPTVTYSEEQIKMLQAIADQAAGAVVKSRALVQSEQRAKQLDTLNEVARSLTSTLDQDILLNQILNKAVEILNCTAGSLLLVDEDTDELVFEQVVGPVASTLLKRRIPPGTGLVGKAVESQAAVIENDVRRAQEWSRKEDQDTGFKTNDIMAVPMISKDKVIGVIEVINRKDKLPFSRDDQELLTAFTSQASIALENARLYTLTDQSLRDSVEELSVMQRIDRELNASLDVKRAMRITLTWAMQQSKANAGIVGITEDQGVKIMASEGYSNELELYLDSYLPAELPALKAAINTAQPQVVVRQPDSDGREIGLLKNAVEQITIPIRRESMVIGVILLESIKTPTVSEETTREFLSRLSDHAAIAIANARLYTEVQAANQAKSDFVSLVSHELKTPMTSIKGFTDLLAAQAVGPINEHQSNFLQTIRSNVDRMATLVSDLADVSRIEAGRLRIEPASLPIKEIVDEVVRSTHNQIEEKRQELTLNILPDLPDMWGDRTRVIQILTNLVSNAYKYTPPEGSIVVNAECADNMWNESSPRVIHISVKDSGYGITPENQKKIFQKFYRSDDEKIREAPGTGLGLNITKQLVELHGGHIWFESVFRVGTTFHFTIPIAEKV